MNVPLCRKLDAALGPQMSKLASDIGEQYSKRVSVLKWVSVNIDKNI